MFGRQVFGVPQVFPVYRVLAEVRQVRIAAATPRFREWKSARQWGTLSASSRIRSVVPSVEPSSIRTISWGRSSASRAREQRCAASSTVSTSLKASTATLR